MIKRYRFNEMSRWFRRLAITFIRAFHEPLESGWSATRVVIMCASLVLLDGILDVVTGPNISFALLYLLPAALVTWLVSRRAGFLFAAASAAVGLICDLTSGTAQAYAAVPYWNCLMRLSVFAIVVWLLAAVRKQTDRLNAAVEHRTKQLQKEISERRRVEREVFQVLQDQKQQMAHELHDGLAQFLTAIAMNTKHLEQELEAGFSPHTEAAAKIVRRLNEAVGQTRLIAHGLSPLAVGANEFVSAVKSLAVDTAKTFDVRCEVHTTLSILPVGHDVGLHLYRIVQQAIDNAIRHGKATGIDITIEDRSSEFRLTIADNGAGFVKDEVSTAGLGFKTMQFRADLVGGRMRVSSQPSWGTCIEIVASVAGLLQSTLPLQPESNRTATDADAGQEKARGEASGSRS